MLNFKLPENDNKYEWTNHVKEKMVYYGISTSLIKRIIRFPKRKEEGVAPRTTAVMQPRGSAKTPQEIWVMYKKIQNSKIKMAYSAEAAISAAKAGQNEKMAELNVPKMKIISAWRYPGVSPVGKKIPIPDEILSAVAEICENNFVD